MATVFPKTVGCLMGRPRDAQGRLLPLGVCLKGHPLVGDNVRLNGKKGKRCCRTCALKRSRLFSKAHDTQLASVARKRRSTAEGKRAQRNQDYKRHYGLTVEKYEAMLAEQGGVCAISGQSPNAKRLHVDHDHATKVVRQLLHSDINTALGLFQDNPIWLRRAADYLERWKKP